MAVAGATALVARIVGGGRGRLPDPGGESRIPAPKQLPPAPDSATLFAYQRSTRPETKSRRKRHCADAILCVWNPRSSSHPAPDSQKNQAVQAATPAFNRTSIVRRAQKKRRGPSGLSSANVPLGARLLYFTYFTASARTMNPDVVQHESFVTWAPVARLWEPSVCHEPPLACWFLLTVVLLGST